MGNALILFFVMLAGIGRALMKLMITGAVILTVETIVFQTLFNWFVASYLRMPMIQFWQSVGVVLLISRYVPLVNTPSRDAAMEYDEDEEYEDEEAMEEADQEHWSEVVAYLYRVVTYAAVILTAGWVVHQCVMTWER